MTDHLAPLFLIGPGYSAQALAAIWQGRVAATVRSKASLSDLDGTAMDLVWIGQGAHPNVNGTDWVEFNAALDGAHIIISAPPGEVGCPALALVGAQASMAASVTYLSTTGVYGDLGGGWAMEWTPVTPGSERAKRRAAAEEAWRAVRPDLRIVRLPGIYGPGRSALERVKAGTARRILKPGQVFSRVHVDDIASGLKALIEAGEAHTDGRVSGVFHLTDEEAAPPQDVIAYAADLLGVESPPEVAFEAADLSPMARSFYAECKRVSNARVKAVTGWRPKYTTYREGLRALAMGLTKS
ncbi:MAG: SDR family NAD(P)-dependent oxidoreductase [Pseudomonadota bacterium]